MRRKRTPAFKKNASAAIVEFMRWHSEFLRELVAKYKERALFPVFPTQIIEHYTEPEDKDIAIFAALCMNWDNGKELRQIAAMRKLMGEHPWEWFCKREFVVISVGERQEEAIDGYRHGRYWKVAKVFDLLYDECRREGGVLRPSVVFGRKGIKAFCAKADEVCGIKDADFKAGVMELVMRTQDGIGRGLWRDNGATCPLHADTERLLREWFPSYLSTVWTWEEATQLFGLEHGYDFFYAWLAYRELQRTNPHECSRYGTVYHLRWKRGEYYPRYRWIGVQGIVPSINF